MLKDEELLAILLGHGIKGRNVFQIARDILTVLKRGQEDFTVEQSRALKEWGGGPLGHDTIRAGDLS